LPDRSLPARGGGAGLPWRRAGAGEPLRRRRRGAGREAESRRRCRPGPGVTRPRAEDDEPMTYCAGILVDDGLVMIADTRTNAGLDNISTFRKLHVFGVPGQRIMALASSGNLSISQSVVSTV